MVVFKFIVGDFLMPVFIVNKKQGLPCFFQNRLL